QLIAVLPQDKQRKSRNEEAVREIRVPPPLEGQAIENGVVEPDEEENEQPASRARPKAWDGLPLLDGGRGQFDRTLHRVRLPLSICEQGCSAQSNKDGRSKTDNAGRRQLFPS